MDLFRRQHGETHLPQRFLRMCRRNLCRPKLADSSGIELTGATLLARTWILRRLLGRCGLGQDEKYVGILLPPSVAAVVTNAALSLDVRIAVNLNYTAGPEVINACIGQCGIRHVLTSRRVMARLQIEIQADVIYLEDLEDKVTWSDKLIAAAVTWLVPIALLEFWLGLGRIDPDDVRDGNIHFRHDGLPEGGHAHLSQRWFEYRRPASNSGIAAERCRSRDSPFLPLLRLHGNALDHSDHGAQRRLSPQSPGAAADWKALAATRRNDHGRHGNISAILPATLRTG